MINRNFHRIIDGAVAIGAGTAVDVSNYKYGIATIFTTGSGNGTVKAQGSAYPSEPTSWTSTTVTTSNLWSYLAMYKQGDSSLIAGNTGVSFTGSDPNPTNGDEVHYYLNFQEGMHWLNFRLTARSAGTFYVYLTLFND